MRYWVERFAGVAQLAEAVHLKWTKWGFESLHQHQHRPYAYLLGMDLGDGHIAHLQRAYALRIYLHRDQVDIMGSLLGLRWRRASLIHIDITRRADVARLDRLLGCTSESDEASS